MRRPADPDRVARREWARRRQRVLEQYLTAAIGRLAAEGRASELFLYDPFAGRGEEENETVSVILIARLAESWATAERPVRVHLFLSEARKQPFDQLRQALTPWIEQGRVTLLRGTLANHQAQVLEAATDRPLFVLLDPLAPNELPFQVVQAFLEREGVTELLLVLFGSVVSRALSTLQSNSRSPLKLQEENAAALDALFGDGGWRGLLATPQDMKRIVAAYGERLRALPAFRASALPFTMEVQHGERLQHHLIHFTRQRESLARMNDAFQGVEIGASECSEQLRLPDLLLAESGTPTFELERHEQERRAELWVLKAVRNESVLLSREELIHRCMVAHFGEFSETEWRRAVRRLVARTSGPRLEAPGALSGKGGAPQLNDVVRLRYTE